MGQWSKLSAKEKAQIIKFAINNGVSDIDSIRDTYNVYADGGSIHIDKNKRGTFTAAATKHGESVQEFASQVLAHKENYSPAMVKKANFARNFGGHHHEDGGEIDTNNNRPQDQPQISWIESWLNSRKDVLAKNIADTKYGNQVVVYSPKNNTGDVRDSGVNADFDYPIYNPLYWFLGQNPRIKQAEKIINREVQNIRNVPVTNVGNEYKPSYGMLGVYVKPSYLFNSGNYVAFLGIPKDEVKIHEFTHASNPEPQEYYIQDVLYKDENIPKSIPGDSKYNQSSELYAALQEVRYKSGLKPNVVVDEQWLENNKKYFENTYLEGLPNNILIRLFNEVAQNSSSFKKSDNTYLAALGGNLKSTGGPLYPFSFQKNPYLKIPAVRYGEGGKIWGNDLALNRATTVHSNYEDAKDLSIPSWRLPIQKKLFYWGLPSALSNCTLTATQWVDPTNPIMSARTIFNNPKLGYTEINAKDALPGDLLIAKNPKKGTYHTMMIEGFDSTNQPILRYSKGGAGEENLRTGMTLSGYHAADIEQKGNHTEDHYFRYSYPNEFWLPEITVTASKK